MDAALKHRLGEWLEERNVNFTSIDYVDIDGDSMTLDIHYRRDHGVHGFYEIDDPIDLLEFLVGPGA